MNSLSHSPAAGARIRAARAGALIALPLALLALAGAARGDASTSSTPSAGKQLYAATLEQCLTSGPQSERAATFAGEMSAIPGSAKMQMRIDVLERLPREEGFHAVTAPGLGVWRAAALGVKTYKYLKEVTNLAAPASYRAAVHFRWLNTKGKLIKSEELRTQRCVQPALPPEPPAEAPGATGGT